MTSTEIKVVPYYDIDCGKVIPYIIMIDKWYGSNYPSIIDYIPSWKAVFDDDWSDQVDQSKIINYAYSFEKQVFTIVEFQELPELDDTIALASSITGVDMLNSSHHKLCHFVPEPDVFTNSHGENIYRVKPVYPVNKKPMAISNKSILLLPVVTDDDIRLSFYNKIILGFNQILSNYS